MLLFFNLFQPVSTWQLQPPQRDFYNSIILDLVTRQKQILKEDQHFFSIICMFQQQKYKYNFYSVVCRDHFSDTFYRFWCSPHFTTFPSFLNLQLHTARGKIRAAIKEAGPIKCILFRYLPKLKVTEFRKNEDYSFYVLGSNFAFMGKSNREKYIYKEVQEFLNSMENLHDLDDMITSENQTENN